MHTYSGFSLPVRLIILVVHDPSVFSRSPTVRRNPDFLNFRPQHWVAMVTVNKNWDFLSSGILLSKQWQFLTDVSRQPIGPIFNGQQSRKKMRKIGRPETSVTTYRSTLSEIPESEDLNLDRGWSLKSQKKKISQLSRSRLQFLGKTSPLV
jgi:hypothetical protein